MILFHDRLLKPTWPPHVVGGLVGAAVGAHIANGGSGGAEVERRWVSLWSGHQSPSRKSSPVANTSRVSYSLSLKSVLSFKPSSITGFIHSSHVMLKESCCDRLNEIKNPLRCEVNHLISASLIAQRYFYTSFALTCVNVLYFQRGSGFKTKESRAAGG